MYGDNLVLKLLKYCFKSFITKDLKTWNFVK